MATEPIANMLARDRATVRVEQAERLRASRCPT